MKMIIFFILLAAYLCQDSFSLYKFTADLAVPFQKYCENLSPDLLIYKDVHRTLLCGSPLFFGELSRNLRQHALIHLFIVSGGHFLFLEKFFVKVNVPQALRIPLLLFYNFFTGFQPPGTRSLSQMILTRCAKNTRLNLRDDQLQLFCGFLLLSLFPQYCRSASFLLSWNAALALNICSVAFFRFSGFKKIFYSQILISVILLPWLWAFGNGHPLGILSNIIFGPIIVFVLFPLSALVILFPFLATLFDQLTWLFEWSLQHTAVIFPESLSQGTHLEFFWIYLLVQHLLLHWYQVSYWQEAH